MGAGVRPDSLQGGQNEFGLAASVCIDVPGALKRVGFSCWNRHLMRKAWVVCFWFGFHFVVLFFVFFFPNLVSQLRHNTEFKRTPLSKTKYTIKYVTANPLLSLIQYLIVEVFFKFLPITEN